MTRPHPHKDADEVVVPYEDFVARRERRARIEAELARVEGEQTIDGEVLSVTIIRSDDERDETH